MTSSLLAALCLLSLDASPTGAAAPLCQRPAECRAGEACLGGQCRAGADRARVEILHTVALSQPQPLGRLPHLVSAAAEVGHHLARDLAWSGLYGVLDAAGPDRPAGATRTLEATLEPAVDLGSYRLRLRLIDVERGAAIDLREGDVVVRPGGVRRAVAGWVNALIAHDTGLPGVVGTRVVASVEVRRGIKEIGVMDADGDGFGFVTANGSLNLGPSWGPFGQIGYMSYASGNPDWVVDGRPLSNRPGLNAAGAWSPDGRLLALSITEGANSDLVLLDGATGRERRRLTRHQAVDTSPAWSPDGRHVAFVSDRSGSPQIWVIGVDGSARRRVTSGGYITSPAWSPVGDTLVYTQQVGGGRFAIVRHDLDSGRVSRLTDGSPSTESPSFSPDGRYLVFTRADARGRGVTLWVMDADGERARPMNTPAYSMFSPDWGPAAGSARLF